MLALFNLTRRFPTNGDPIEIMGETDGKITVNYTGSPGTNMMSDSENVIIRPHSDKGKGIGMFTSCDISAGNDVTPTCSTVLMMALCNKICL